VDEKIKQLYSKQLMKLLFVAIAFLLMLVSVLPTSACDICGCNMNTAATILPQLDKSLIGIRYNYALFNSSHPSSMTNELAGLNSNDIFQSLELFARYNVKERFQISAMVPFKISTQKISTGDMQNYGLGDIILLGQFLAISPKRCTGKRGQHQVRLGVGLKFPSGSFEKKMHESLLHANLQNGSGSLDLFFSALYTWKYKNWGGNLEAGYRLNTMNANRYKFGNRSSLKMTVFYWWNIKNHLTILPTLGLTAEHAEPNLDNKRTAPYTGGYGINSQAGFDVLIRNAVISFHTQPTVYQRWSDGYVRRRAFVEAGLFYNF
jgi:opacity protein-like surface antigen